jgi:hypothetical protein
MGVILLDFEASGLGPRSCPIEVAWRDGRWRTANPPVSVR